MADQQRSTSLPTWIAGSADRAKLFLEVPTEDCGTSDEPDEESDTPIARLLAVLQALLSGTQVDMAAVKWLWMRIATGDFVMGAFPSHSHFRVPMRGMEKDVGASLALLLGPNSMRRSSKCSDIESGCAAMSIQSGHLSNRSSIDMSTRLDSMSDLTSACEEAPMEEDLWPITTAPVEEVEAVLRKADSWGFDVFKLAEVTDGHALSSLAFWLLGNSGIISDLGVDAPKLATFWREIERRYPDTTAVPYHNATHAADVLQQMHMLLTAGGLAEVAVRREPLATLACYLAAIIHDVDHQGVSNDFLIRTEDRLALMYNDASPQENHHLATAFQVLGQPECNFVRGFVRDRKVKLRRLTISMVLATDMKLHVGLMSALQSKVDVKKLAVTQPQPLMRSQRSASTTAGMATGRRQVLSGADSCGIFDSEAGCILALQTALKCADLGHAAAPMEVHARWVSCLEEEMFRQGDRELAAKLPISPLMDRTGDGVSKSQCDFLERVALPLFRVWATMFPGATPMVTGAEANLQRWLAAKACQDARPSQSLTRS